MNSKKLAVLFGGCSTEYAVSLQSAMAVLHHLDPERFRVIPIGITRQGDWYQYTGDYDKISQNTWFQDPAELVPVVVSQNRSHPGFLTFPQGRPVLLPVDLVFPVLHGKNGEDGTLQGMFALAGIPVVGCNTLSSALCMDKDRAHKLVSLEGIPVPHSIMLHHPMSETTLFEITSPLAYPLFVKPVRSGSSFGITKVLEPCRLLAAVQLAFTYDTEVLVEEAVCGFEVGCAILGNESPLVGRVDEIELSDGFFDYTEKYTLKTSKIHMPARIDAETECRIQQTALKIYRTLGCSGFARVDLFLTPDGTLFFNEVNTIPGLTSHSRYPHMLEGTGLSFSAMLERLLHLYEEGHHENHA